MATAQDAPSHSPGRSRLPLIIVGVIVWAVLLVLSALLWERAFDFTREEAWMMSVALFGYIGLFVIAMVGISMALTKDH